MKAINGVVLGLCLGSILTGCTQPPPDGGGPGGDGSSTLPELDAPPAFALDKALAPAPVLAGQPLLNEVHYEPEDGFARFVELKGATTADLTAGLSLRNENGEVYAIPATLVPANANGIVTILFDGLDQTAGDTAHSAATGFLTAESGLVILENSVGTELDRVAWGAERAEAVRMHGTGLIAMPAGVGCCRRPQSVGPAAMDDWFIASPIDPTPGTPNHHLGARMLFPFDGAIVRVGEVRLDWEYVRNAVQFQLQVAGSPDFASPVIDQTVAEGPVDAVLAAGGYYWRVQAQFADGSLADWSPIRRLIVLESIDEDAFLPGDSPVAKSIVTLQGTPVRKKLSRRVPMYFQRKDSHMLLLESDGPSGTSHAWDAPHARLDKGDPADRTNCALASISMVNGYFAGKNDGDTPNLTQDRIGFHIHTSAIHPDSANHPGPEFDLNFDSGNEPRFYQAGLDFALGMEIPAAYRGFSGLQAAFKFLGGYPTEFREQFWKDLGVAIAADKPVPFAVYNGQQTFDSHAMVARLRLVIDGVRYVQVNDPWEGVMYYPLDSMFVFEYWMIPDGVTPRADEDELRNRTDSDKDGIMDFEERERFKTRWENDDERDRDTDQDCVNDMTEVRNSVLETRHGWGQYWTKFKKGLPTLSDGSFRKGKAPELDSASDPPDTDEAGLPDTVEDLNKNGQVDSDETDSNDSQDDPTKVTGYHLLFRDWDDAQTHVHTLFDRRLEFDLQIMPGGKVTGTASVTHHYRTVQTFEPSPPECPNPRTRTIEMPELKYTQKIKGRFICQSLILEAEDVATLPQQNGTVTDTCQGNGPAWITIFPFGSANLGLPQSGGGGTVIYKQISTERTGSMTHFDWELTLSR